MSNNTVVAIRDEEWQQVAARKARIAAQSERNATRAAELIAEKLERENVPLNVLVPVFGVSVDKALALRSDPTINVQHQHQHIHAHIDECTFEELLANLPKRNAQDSIESQLDNAPG